MSKLKMKAKAGFTLVELLVVMLIVAILTVTMLPFFKEYICKAQYTSDALPVIGDLRTKIGLYYYDHGKLPGNPEDAKVASWDFKDGDHEAYVVASYGINAAPGTPTYSDIDGKQKMTATGKDRLTDKKKNHFGDMTVIDIDYSSLKGKRSLPIDYVYYKIPCMENGVESKTDYAYVVGCFGSGEGLAAGTGYAVCELNFASIGKKYVGTFERYKAKAKASDTEDDEIPYLYLSKEDVGEDGEVSGDKVYCPEKIEDNEKDDSGTDKRPAVITTFENNGWKFSD